MTHSDWPHRPFLSHRATNSSNYGNHIPFLAAHSRCPGWTDPILKGNGNWDHVDRETCTSSCDWCPFCYFFSGDQALKPITTCLLWGKERSRQRSPKRLPNKMLTTSTRLESPSLLAPQPPLTDQFLGKHLFETQTGSSC